MPSRKKRRVDISILGPVKAQLSRSWLRGIASLALDQALPGETVQMGLVIADDDTLKRLNRDYRGLDEVTDVLSFSNSYHGQWQGGAEPPVPGEADLPFVMPAYQPKHLGEVVISYPQVVRQAGPGQAGLEAELALLIVHGVLHLLGFDHEEPSEEAAMQAKEQEFLSSISS